MKTEFSQKKKKKNLPGYPNNSSPPLSSPYQFSKMSDVFWFLTQPIWEIASIK